MKPRRTDDADDHTRTRVYSVERDGYDRAPAMGSFRRAPRNA